MESEETQLDYSSPLPLHFQIRSIIKSELTKGLLADRHGKIPTEKKLSERFKVSRITIRAALENLENEGVVNRVRGRGTFINANRLEKWTGQLLGFAETIESAGFKPGAQTLEYGIKKNLDSKIKEELQIESAWGIKRLRFADNYPIAVEHRYFPIDLGLEFEKNNLNKLLIYKYLEEKLDINLSDGKQTISALNANKDNSELLNISKGSALLFVQRLTCSENGRRIEFLKAYYRPEFFQYIVELKR